jgi:DNA-nicking Smr family endonuclease|tara:strand:+ start:2233 stop:2451 length:219 start_codon:yes stop_codon:yes gene_type:complete
MVEIDLHGLTHEEVKDDLENKLLLHYNMGNFPIRVITGNSLMMKKIVSTALENLRFKKSSINTHNGSIVVVE